MAVSWTAWKFRQAVSSIQLLGRSLRSTALSSEKSGPGVVKEGENPLELSSQEWKKRLTSEQYYVCRQKGTEPPHTSSVDSKAKDHKGVFVCVCCGAELFSSDTKFESGSGWPSFHTALELSDEEARTAEQSGSQRAKAPKSNVMRNVDRSHGMIREEVVCKQCNSHLGHVFNDGPQPTGERFCINGVALEFVPKDKK